MTVEAELLELQIVDIEQEKNDRMAELIEQYWLLNQKCDKIIERRKSRKTSSGQ